MPGMGGAGRRNRCALLGLQYPLAPRSSYGFGQVSTLCAGRRRQNDYNRRISSSPSPMQGITKYILRELVGAMLFVTFALTGVVWLSHSLRFVDLIVNRGLSIGTFFHFTLLLMPTFLSVILPFALFCAVVYTYHRLTIDSELVVLRAAGLSQIALARPALILAGVVTLVCYSIMLYFMPLGFREFRDRYVVIRGDYTQILLREGTFNKIVKGITVYVRTSQSNGELRGILVHDNRDPNSPVTMMAERGALVRSPDGPRLLLINGNRQEVDANGRSLRLLTFDRNIFDLSNLAGAKGPRWRKPRERYLHELLGPLDSERDITHLAELRAEGHQRLVAPLFSMVFALIGLAATLAGKHSQRGRVPRILLGAGAVVVFQVLALALGDLIVDRPLLTPLLYFSLIVASAAAAFVLSRTRLRRRHTVAAGFEAGAA
ncbi:MAG: LPS export ABC transporter permease LptF [Proteobacteria bacterium]|nr:LPS export ABC transporter permease LptF [Pseudomonadota bacterium]